jgi:hypothetical protein
VGPLVGALMALRETLARVRYPLAGPNADEATHAAHAIVDQLDDYLLPRLGRLDAPLLVVVGRSRHEFDRSDSREGPLAHAAITRLRPLRLALYSAPSARSTSSPGAVCRLGTSAATPMLSVTTRSTTVSFDSASATIAAES